MAGGEAGGVRVVDVDEGPSASFGFYIGDGISITSVRCPRRGIGMGMAAL